MAPIEFFFHAGTREGPSSSATPGIVPWWGCCPKQAARVQEGGLLGVRLAIEAGLRALRPESCVYLLCVLSRCFNFAWVCREKAPQPPLPLSPPSVRLGLAPVFSAELFNDELRSSVARAVLWWLLVFSGQPTTAAACHNPAVGAPLLTSPAYS